MKTTDLLCRVPWLAPLGPGRLAAIADRWGAVRLPEGDPLWRQGAHGSDLAVLVDGELAVEVDGSPVGSIRAGELVGEAAAFFRETRRSATVRARAFSQIVVLPVEELARLRAESSPVYSAVLDEANATLARRVRATGQRIAAATVGERTRPGAEPGQLARLWRRLVPGRPKGAPPDCIELFRRQPGLGTLTDAELSGIARRWKPVAAQEGQVLVLEGDAGDAAWMVASGEVDVLRNVRGDRASRLATLVPGDTFGVNALLDPGPRTASCVATRPTWLFRLDRVDFVAPPGPAGVCWRESILACLASQIRAANQALTMAGPRSTGRAPSPEGFQQVLRAHGMLAGFPLSEESIDVRL